MPTTSMAYANDFHGICQGMCVHIWGHFDSIVCYLMLKLQSVM